MKIGNLIGGIIVLLLFASPFIYSYLKNSGQRKKLTNKLKEYAKNNGMKIDETEADFGTVLGIDKTNKVAFWGLRNGDGIEVAHVPLMKMSSVRLINNSNKGTDNLGKSTDMLSLNFYPKEKDGKVQSFVLFDGSQGGRITGELLLANDWLKKYEEIMK